MSPERTFGYMEFDELFQDEPQSGRDKILRAVYKITKNEGYGSVSIQLVADVAGLSKATVYHHFEDKDDLMLSFYESVLDKMGEQIGQIHISDPIDRLHGMIDRMVLGQLSDEVANRAGDELPSDTDIGPGDPLRTFMEIRVQAIHEAAYRDRISTIDQAFRDVFTSAIEDGIEQGRIREIDAERTADMLYTLLLGGLLRRTTTDDADLKAIREEAYEVVDRSVVD